MQRPEIFSIENYFKDSIPQLEVVDADHSENIFIRLFHSLKTSIVEYCSISSVGVLSHLTSHGTFRRILWLILVVSSLIGCYFTNVSILGTHELLILNEDNTMSTSDIPFPAVTVCTTVKADHRKFNYDESYNRLENFTQDE